MTLLKGKARAFFARSRGALLIAVGVVALVGHLVMPGLFRARDEGTSVSSPVDTAYADAVNCDCNCSQGCGDCGDGSGDCGSDGCGDCGSGGSSG